MKARPSMPAARSRSHQNPIQLAAVAELPTRQGPFRVVAFSPDANGDEHLALVHGRVRGESDVPVRVHSECLTGDVLGSLRCDCRAQLEQALERIAQMPKGIVLYLRQEGRGIGLTNKIRAYALQDNGHDTVDANALLGFEDDARDYRVAADMLAALGVKSVQLMTNNPRKLEGLARHGVRISSRLPHATTPTRQNAGYLLTKQKRSGHWLGIRETPATEATPAKAPAPTTA